MRVGGRPPGKGGEQEQQGDERQPRPRGRESVAELAAGPVPVGECGDLRFAQAAHENCDVEKPALPWYWMPKASILDRVAFATFSSEPAGWKTPVSFAGWPVSTPKGTTSSISKSTASPMRIEWRRPSSLTSIDARSTPRFSAINGPEGLHRAAECPREHGAELLGLLVGRRRVDEDAKTPVALAHHLRGVRESGNS